MADELKDQRIPIMMSPSEVKAIDDWAFERRIRSRSDAVRRLCKNGIVFEPALSVAMIGLAAVLSYQSEGKIVDSDIKKLVDSVNRLSKTKKNEIDRTESDKIADLIEITERLYLNSPEE